ncbi:hypothetical protein BN8_03681 [Fibrisoma limi BUZ 3]|uniref:Uncharacterized protein n=1 Tax=Fibrisoma limi BUZ 3 TaxID=1185876 RepID=I2GKS9_9BACT|nr:hypothetical protein [Fibrisoma limi]CCH54505.1 hypothetical protein BN8_03681 [Fibrisoma limi BUZ 3]
MMYQLPINRPPRRRYCIGIDPDKTESGFAVWDRQDRKWLRHEGLEFWALQMACFEYPQAETEVFVEAGWHNQGMHRSKKDSLPKGFETWKAESREGYMWQRGADTGVNFGAGHAIIAVLRANHYLVKEYTPTSAKWDAELLRQITGIKARTNQDVRDAIRAAYMNR